MYLDGDTVELILVRKAPTNHSAICAGVKEHTVNVATEAEGIAKKGVFICLMGSG